ncbi:hypothetical protein [Faecalicatena contorta]|uniref:hypothetical protein n=1 Tax=Faecalicatena contorta TaxID=39482 RepID=UPI001F35BD8D|nr:hypothetical protein [Faecalicatena contorta]MCF2554420.1 hypothetical protein [Faecalicatena contorta]
MNAQRIAEHVKYIVMNELIVDINSKQCAIDLFLDNSVQFKEINKKLNKVLQLFLKNQKLSNKKNRNYGQILFFRKYDYENY